MSDDEPEGTEYELVMPFVVCESVGGPHNDAAYCAGWDLGALDLRLTIAKAIGAHIAHVMIREDNEPQFDLLLMKHGAS